MQSPFTVHGVSPGKPVKVHGPSIDVDSFVLYGVCYQRFYGLVRMIPPLLLDVLPVKKSC